MDTAEIQLKRSTRHLQEWFDAYRWENQAFADAAASLALLRNASDDGVFQLVQDYQLMLVPQMIRKKSPHQKISWFCHIPWPDIKALSAAGHMEGFQEELAPYWRQLVDGLLGADSIGFHTPGYVQNFLSSAKELGYPVEREPEHGSVTVGKRRVRVFANPIGVGRQTITRFAKDLQFRTRVQQIRRKYGKRKIILAFERGDYTKGVVAHLEAYGRLLDRRPELVEEHVFIQVAPPTRQEIPEYRRYQRKIEREAKRIQARHGTAALELHTVSMPYREMLAHVRAAHLVVATPTADGYNLSGLEAAAINVGRSPGVVFSSGAGSATALQGTPQHPGAVIVPPPTRSPESNEQLVAGLEQAIDMPPSERRARMKVMKDAAKRYPVERWLGNLIGSLDSNP